MLIANYSYEILLCFVGLINVSPYWRKIFEKWKNSKIMVTGRSLKLRTVLCYLYVVVNIH